MPTIADISRVQVVNDEFLGHVRKGLCQYVRGDTERLTARAKSAGVDVTFREWKGVVHAAISLMGWIDAMGLEVDRIGEFMRRVTVA